jgi:hypothetical protein
MILTVAAVGCMPPQAPAPPTPPPPTPSAQSSKTAAPTPTAAPASVASDSAFPKIPDGAQWTIFCMAITTPTHVPDSERLKQQLITKTGSRDWYVVHSENVSMLYYGFYKTFDDNSQPQEKARAQGDRRMVAALRDNGGDQPFAQCVFQSLANPDPPAPPEWDLKNAKGYWALQIAAYRGSALRKQYAVDAVRAARAAGIEAYFSHGESVSTVFIGTWPREAVKEQDQSTGHSDDPNKTIVVLPQPLPSGYRTDVNKAGQPIKVLVPKIEIVDPTLLKAMHDYPANVVNGEEIMHKVQSDHGIVEVPDPSFLVQIPHDDAGSTPAPVSGAGE